MTKKIYILRPIQTHGNINICKRKHLVIDKYKCQQNKYIMYTTQLLHNSFFLYIFLTNRNYKHILKSNNKVFYNQTIIMIVTVFTIVPKRTVPTANLED